MSNPENQGPMPDMPEGLPFTKESAIRRFTEPATGLLYPYMAGLTTVRAEIGAAVDEHSAFREQPFRRLGHTIMAASQLVFGKQEESLATAQRIWEFHKSVQGEHHGIKYSANDIDMQVWVLGCVFMGVNEAKRRWVKPLEPEERQALYSDFRTFGLFFGLPYDAMTKDVREFDEYLDYTIENDTVQTETSREVTRTVMQADVEGIPKWMQRATKAVSVTALDERLQESLGLVPSKEDEQLAQRIDRTIRGINVVLPLAARRQITPIAMGARRVFSKRPRSTATCTPGVKEARRP